MKDGEECLVLFCQLVGILRAFDLIKLSCPSKCLIIGHIEKCGQVLNNVLMGFRLK